MQTVIKPDCKIRNVVNSDVWKYRPVSLATTISKIVEH